MYICEAILLQQGSCSRLDTGLRLSVGCPLLDELLRGGLPTGGIVELSGESGAGKTQLALQLCLSVQLPVQHGGLGAGKPPQQPPQNQLVSPCVPKGLTKTLLHSLFVGAVYVCTEDVFPSRRLQQLIREQPQLRCQVPLSLLRSLHFSDHIYVEHAGDLVGVA